MKHTKQLFLLLLLAIVSNVAAWGQAELPFEYDEGTPSGVLGFTHSGCGNSYSSSPKIKFDDTGDNVTLYFTGKPGVLSFDIKLNGSTNSSNKFTVSVSTDGEAFSDLAVYSGVAGIPTTTKSYTIENIPVGTQYIRWTYTNKGSGNVGLGNIKLTKASSTSTTLYIKTGDETWHPYVYSYSGNQEFTGGWHETKATDIIGENGIKWHTIQVPSDDFYLILSDGYGQYPSEGNDGIHVTKDSYFVYNSSSEDGIGNDYALEVEYANVTVSDITVKEEATQASSINAPEGLFLHYQSSDTEVATVDENGIVTGVSEGNATIFVSWGTQQNVGGKNYVNGSKKYTVNVISKNEPLLYEGFSGFTDYITNAELSKDNEYLDYKSWTSFSKVYYGGATSDGTKNNYGKLGTRNAKGSMYAENIPLTGSGTLSLLVKEYSGDTGTLNITITGANIEGETTITPPSVWTEYSFNLTDAQGNVSLKIETSSNRANVDEIKIIPSGQTVNKPVISPDGGSFPDTQEVTITAGEGCTIYYTIDGSDPSAESTVYTAPFTINTTTTVKAIAIKDGKSSSVASATFSKQKANPNLAFSKTKVTANIGESFTPPTLSYAEGYDGTITYLSSNSAITVNTSTGEVSFDASAAGKTTTITATAKETDNFSAGTASYVLNVVNPNAIEGNLNNATFGTNYNGSITPIGEFSSVSGIIGGVTVTYAKGTSSNAYINDNEIRLYNGVELTFEAPDGYYISSLTFDATLANCSSEEGDIKDKTLIAKDEQTTVTITKTTTGGLTLKSVTITLCPAASSIAAPTITPPTGTYTEAQTVVITNNADGATVYYTTDGSNPTAVSTQYTAPFVLSKSGTYTVKAIAILDDQSSRIVTNTITINIHVDAPVISSANGTPIITEETPITITGAEGTTIYYTTDGSDPVKDGALTGTAKAYTDEFTLTKAGTVKAVARDAGGNFSEIVSATYTYNGTVTAPYYENFDEGLGNFTVETSGTDAPEWIFRISTGSYGTRKYAYVNGSGKQGTTRLVSPVIDLTDETIQNVTLSFVHAGRYFDGYNAPSCTSEQTKAGNAPTHAQVFVREEGGTWQKVTILNWFTQAGSDDPNIYERVNSGEIPLDGYKGKKIQVSFLYTADESSTGIWNVLKFALTTTKAAVENYEIVEMKTNGFVTYVVQNDIDVAKTLENNTKEEGANVHIYKVTEFSKTEAVFGEFGYGGNETVIPAETPVIIKGTRGENKLVIAKGGDIIAKPANNLLLPSYGDVAPTDEQHLLVFQKTSDWNEAEPYSNYAFFKLKKGRTIPNRKAYLNGTDFKESITTQTNPAKGIFLMEDLDMDYEIPLGVEIVNTTNRGRSAGVFDLMGRKVADKAENVSAAVLQKGVYIVNGRKVVVK